MDAFHRVLLREPESLRTSYLGDFRKIGENHEAPKVMRVDPWLHDEHQRASGAFHQFSRDGAKETLPIERGSPQMHGNVQKVQLAQLQASEHDEFAAHLYRSRREYRSACQRAGKGGKQIERCVISSFQVAESMGFKGEFRQWEHLLRVGD